MTRDKLGDSRQVVNQLFFDKIFDMLLTTDDERNRIKALETLGNLVHAEEHRLKLANDEYLKKVYETFSASSRTPADARTLEKISQMTTLICFYPDMID